MRNETVDLTAPGDFLRRHNGRRCGMAGAPPSLFGMGGTDEDGAAERTESNAVLLDYERPETAWTAIALGTDDRTTDARYQRFAPVRYVDGKDVGRTAAWLETAAGYPLPVRVGQIGAAVLRCAPDPLSPMGGAPHLECEYRVVERVVSLEANSFTWDEIEGFAAALQANGLRLLIPSKRAADVTPFDFGALHNIVNKRTTEEMFRLEGRTARGYAARNAESFPAEPTVLDGRLEDKIGPIAGMPFGFTDDAAVYGVIKKHATLDYLHDLGGRVFVNLAAGERTPAFVLQRDRLHVVTWYVRTDASDRTAPNEGILRVEIPRRFYERVVGSGEWSFLDWLSRYLLRRRTRDATYGRAAVTLLPVQRAEEMLGAHFTELDRVVGDFYRLTRL